MQTGVVATIKRPITLIYRDVNGTLHRLLADETETNRFYLNAERSRVKAETEKEIAALLLDEAFSDRQDTQLAATRIGILNGHDLGRF